MADRATATDNTNQAHKASDKSVADAAHVQPTRADHDAHAAAMPRATDQTGGGQIDKQTNTLNVGDTAALYGGQKTGAGSETNGEKTAAAAAVAPPVEKGVKPEVAGKDNVSRPGDIATPPLDKTNLGDAPPTRSTEITYKSENGFGAKEVQESREKLTAAEDAANMSPELKASMQKHMDNLEHRLPPATAEQIKGVYDATADLLKNSEGKSPLTSNDRNRLANDILSNAAQQHEIDQGMHNTCNVTTIEESLNRQSPDKAARVVADVGLGKFTGLNQHDSTAQHGPDVQLDPKSLRPDSESNYNGTQARDGDRNYASQLFDMAAVNDYWQHKNPNIMYTQTNARDGQGDTGERLMVKGGGELTDAQGNPVRSPKLGTAAIADINKSLGLDTHVISTKEFQQSDSNGRPGEVRANSYEDFKNALEKNPNSIVFLNGRDKLFSGSENNGGAMGGHVVTVSDFRKGPPDEVYMRNQWGSGKNQWVSVADLYNASLPPDSNNRVGHQEVANNNPNAQKHTGSGSEVSHDEGGRSGRGNEVSHGEGLRNGGGDRMIERTDENMLNDKDFQEFQEKAKKDAEKAEEEKAKKAETPKPNDQDRTDNINKLQKLLDEAPDEDTRSKLKDQINQLKSLGN